MSDTGIEYKTPSSSKNSGSNRAKPTPKTTSLIMERIVDSLAFPMACRKIKHALFTQAKTIIQR